VEYLIVFPKANLAIKAEKALLNSGLSVSVMPLPPEIDSGCGIALRVDEASLNDALNALELVTVYSREHTPGGYKYSKIGEFNGSSAVNP